MRSVSRQVFSRDFAHVRQRLSGFSPSFHATIYQPVGSACGDDKYTTGVGNHYHDRTVNETRTARRLKRLKKIKKNVPLHYIHVDIYVCYMSTAAVCRLFVFYLFIYTFLLPPRATVITSHDRSRVGTNEQYIYIFMHSICYQLVMKNRSKQS